MRQCKEIKLREGKTTHLPKPKVKETDHVKAGKKARPDRKG